MRDVLDTLPAESLEVGHAFRVLHHAKQVVAVADSGVYTVPPGFLTMSAGLVGPKWQHLEFLRFETLRDEQARRFKRGRRR